jgi:predicted nucleic acid-binding protein
VARYLLDTDVIIQWLRGDEDVTAWIAERDAAGDYLACTPVTVAELYSGLKPREEVVIASVLRVLHCADIDTKIGHKAGRYRQRFGASHGTEVADALIAATAHVQGFTLCTRNLRHYPMRDLKKRRV